MSRATACFSMYSLMSMRTMLFSSSKSACANAFASSVLPTPVGPRNRKLPMGFVGSFRPARVRRIASATAVTASSCPMTRSCRISSRWSSFSRSPSISFATGMPVHRATMRAISSSVTRSRRRPSLLPSSLAFSAASSSSFSLGSLPYFSSAARFRSYSRSAFSISALSCSISPRSFCTFLIASFSFSHFALSFANSSRSRASSLRISARCSAESLSFSLVSAASSISSCMMRREISSSSVGMESISVRISAQASSTRSIALSGRNRSEI